MSRITGQQARDLLDRVQPVGNWDLLMRDGEAVPVVVDRERNQKLAEAADCDIAALIVRAPDLAETVAWLYGREPDEGGFSHQGSGWEVEEMQGEIDVLGLSAIYTPDEAVDLARALLAAAEEARDGQ